MKITTETVHFKPMEIIFREGEVGDKAYLIDIGSIELLKKERTRLMVADVIATGFFGLLPLVDGKPRQFTARARQHTTCQVITKEMFTNKMKAADPVSSAVIYLLTQQLRNTSDRLVDGGFVRPAQKRKN